MKYYCNDCKKEVEIGEEDLIPNRGWDILTEEYLLFYVLCPNCKKLSVIEECTSTDKEIIPPDMKLRLMKKYAYVSDEYLEYYRTLREYEIARLKCERMLMSIKNKQESLPDSDRLFDNWKNSDEIVEEISKLQLK